MRSVSVVLFSQRLHIPVGLMNLATRASLAAEDRLGFWSSALTDSPRVPESWQPSRAVRRQGWYSRGAAVVRVEREAEAAGCPSP